MTKKFYSNGKLLLTGEYAILDGAAGLAIPTRYGQSLKVSETDSHHLIWKSLDEKGNLWFETVFEIHSLPFIVARPNIDATATTLLEILKEAQKLNPNFLKSKKGYQVETKLTFPKNWGLGSSSTLINNIAQWAEVDAYQLLWNAFSGSGYDIACATNDSPILYRLKSGKPNVKKVDFNPPFAENLYFIYLNKKQNSREGIAKYRKMDFDLGRLTKKISELTKKVVSCKELSVFEALIAEHETILSEILQIPTVKESLFSDFKGAIKSLGAWGGDFILATGNTDTPSYFRAKGYKTVIPYLEIVKEI